MGKPRMTKGGKTLGGAIVAPKLNVVGPKAPIVLPRAEPVGPAGPPTARRARAERLVDDATKLNRELASAFYRLGVVLRELSQPETYRALGHDTFNALLEERKIVTRMTAFRLIQIVDSFDQRTAETLGVDKGYAVLRYSSLAHPGKTPIEVLTRNPIIRAGLANARLADASARDVIEAIRGLRRDTVPAAYVKRVQRATRGISQRLEHIDIHTAKVRSVARGDRVVVRVEIDGSEAERLLGLLKRL